MIKAIIDGALTLFLVGIGIFIHELGSYCDDVCPDLEDWRDE